jgi:hypothetical protein
LTPLGNTSIFGAASRVNDPAGAPQINDAVPPVNSFIQRCRDNNVLVIWVREIFSDDKMHPNQKALWGSGDDIWLIREDGRGTHERVITK